MWLLFMGLEREIEDSNGNEMCTDRTLWNILCEMCAPHYVLMFVCLFVCFLHCINSDKFVLSNKSNVMNQTSAQ
jgi:hypothetical protein